MEPLSDPSAQDLESPEFNAVWHAIKSWDIKRPDSIFFASATGTDVMTILNALRSAGQLEERPVNETKDLDAPAFTNALESVINYKGDNYYKACGYIVRQTEHGTTSCVKRAGHPSAIHEDYYGVTTDGNRDVPAVSS